MSAMRTMAAAIGGRNAPNGNEVDHSITFQECNHLGLNRLLGCNARPDHRGAQCSPRDEVAALYPPGVRPTMSAMRTMAAAIGSAMLRTGTRSITP